MLVLAVDTSTPWITAGVVRLDPRQDVPGRVPMAAPVEPSARQAHAEQLVPAVRECLRRVGARVEDLDAVVVGEGPGAWTGLRVGLAAAQALAEPHGIAVLGVGTLDAVAAAVRPARMRELAATGPPEDREAHEDLVDRDAATGAVVVADARRREVFWQVHGPCRAQQVGARRGDVQVGPPAEVLGLLEGRLVGLGPGAREALGARGDDVAVLDRVSLVDVARVPADGLVAAALPGLRRLADGGERPGPPRPRYLRSPDVTPPRATGGART